MGNSATSVQMEPISRRLNDAEARIVQDVLGEMATWIGALAERAATLPIDDCLFVRGTAPRLETLQSAVYDLLLEDEPGVLKRATKAIYGSGLRTLDDGVIRAALTDKEANHG